MVKGEAIEAQSKGSRCWYGLLALGSSVLQKYDKMEWPEMKQNMPWLLCQLPLKSM